MASSGALCCTLIHTAHRIAHLHHFLNVFLFLFNSTMQAWRSDKFFDNVFQLVGVPVITVQLRYDGWVTEMQVRCTAGCCVGQTLAEPC